MTSYWVKTPWWLKKLFPKDMVWDMPAQAEPTVYITFDDGPHPKATPFALEQLKKYGARATFFCVGNNVKLFPAIYSQLLSAGHATGNHTHTHMNGWKTPDSEYLSNINEAGKYIDSRLFRPPYGRIKRSQLRQLRQNDPNWKIIMWDVLAADFDKKNTSQQCADNVLRNVRPGSIVLFHDSEKAWDRMSHALPQVLAYCKEQNWKMEIIK